MKVDKETISFIQKIKWKKYDFWSPKHLFLSKSFNKILPKKMEKRQLLFCIAVLAVPLLQVAIMYFAVNFNSFLLAFKEYKIDGTGTLHAYWVGLDNFVKFGQNVFNEGGALFGAFKNSLILFGVNLFIGIPFALLFSFYIYKKKFAYKLFNVLLFLPSIISSIVMVMLFSYFVDRAIPAVFGIFGVKMAGMLSGTDMPRIFGTIVFYNVWIGFGSSILLYSSAMSRIPPDIIEAAQIDGCGNFKEFLKITLPLIYPTISTFVVVQVAGIFSNQANLYSFYSENADPALYTTGYWFFRETMAGRDSFSSYPYAAAGGLMFTIIIAPLTILVRYVLDRFDSQVQY